MFDSISLRYDFNHFLVGIDKDGVKKPWIYCPQNQSSFWMWLINGDFALQALQNPEKLSV
jgi:hypothetical protein